MKRAVASVVVALGAFAATIACGKGEPPPPASSTAHSVSPTATVAGETCPATGLWAQCSVLYRLDRSGVAPKFDSTDTKPEEKLFTAPMFVVKIGQAARLEVYLYPDSTARIADEKTLDRARFVNDTSAQTIKRERTLIESVNLIGLLTSINSHQRQRVSDALTAGPPQPAGK